MYEVILKILQNLQLAELFPNILALAKIALVMPVSTAAVERGFSTLKRIKTRLRSRLQDATLSDLMTIRIEGPKVSEFDPKKAIESWKEMRKRRAQ
jgi:hypothetical protein